MNLIHTNTGSEEGRDSDSPNRHRHFGRAIYLFIFILSASFALLGLFIVNRGAGNAFLLGLSTDLLVVALVFFLINEFFQWRSPEDEKQDRKLKELDLRLQSTDKVLKKLDELITDPGVQATPEDTCAELIKEVRTSENSINIVSRHNLNLNQDDRHKGKYLDILLERSQSNPPITFRRIIWNQEHLSILKQWAEWYDSIHHAEFRFFVPTQGENTPVIPCAIIDENVVNFGWGYLGRPSIDEVNISLRNAEVVKLFMEYFTFLWQKSVPIKRQGEPLNLDKVDEIKEALTVNSPSSGYIN